MQSFPGIIHYTIIALRDLIQTDFQLDLATIPTSRLIFTSTLAYEMFSLKFLLDRERMVTD